MRIELITALPDLVRSPLEDSIIKRAATKGYVSINVVDLRRFAKGKHRQVDDYPYGGGAGMVLKPEPLFACLESLISSTESERPEVIYLTPDGERLDQPLANQISMSEHLILVAGHYKGIDQRVRDHFVTREVSIGDYVLSGGELPALVLIDAVVRLLPGVLGDSSSAMTDSFQDGLLDAPSYTRPAEFRGMRVPDVLLSGDHEAIIEWREQQRIEKTKKRRPDLFEKGTQGVS